MARKHVSQMDSNEISYLMRKVAELKIDKLCQHTTQRMEEREITQEEINATLKDYNIIEYKMDNFGKQSVLIQSAKKINGYYINLVAGLNKNKVVTCFKNPYSDRDVDMSAYNGRLDIRNLIKSDVKMSTGYFRHHSRKACV